jgi:hypothetical protein
MDMEKIDLSKWNEEREPEPDQEPTPEMAAAIDEGKSFEDQQKAKLEAIAGTTEKATMLITSLAGVAVIGLRRRSMVRALLCLGLKRGLVRGHYVESELRFLTVTVLFTGKWQKSTAAV